MISWWSQKRHTELTATPSFFSRRSRLRISFAGFFWMAAIAENAAASFLSCINLLITRVSGSFTVRAVLSVSVTSVFKSVFPRRTLQLPQYEDIHQR